MPRTETFRVDEAVNAEVTPAICGELAGQGAGRSELTDRVEADGLFAGHTVACASTDGADPGSEWDSSSS